MVKIILIFRLIFFYIIFNFSVSYSQEMIIGKSKVIDGDTININNNKIRLHGIDAPERNQNCFKNNTKWMCGVESTDFLKNLIYGKIVHCEINGIDKYKRFIGVCWLKELNLNAFIVKNGWAIAYSYYSKDYIKEEKFAKENKLGIWVGKFEEPYIFRKNQ